MWIALVALFAVLAGCAASPEPDPGDPIGMPADKADNWWMPTRGLALAGEPLTIARGDVGQVVRGTFAPDVYAGAMFTVTQAQTRVSRFTRSWIHEANDQPWHTEPFVFTWRGGDGDVNDWTNWSLLSHCCNNGDVTLPHAGRYLLVVTATAEAYAERTPYVAFVRHWTDYAEPRVGVRGVLRCGAKRQPVAGASMSIDSLPTERVQTRADGSFELGETYAVGRHSVYAVIGDNEHAGLFDVVLAPDGGTLELVLERCP